MNFQSAGHLCTTNDYQVANRFSLRIFVTCSVYFQSYKYTRRAESFTGLNTIPLSSVIIITWKDSSTFWVRLRSLLWKRWACLFPLIALSASPLESSQSFEKRILHYLFLLFINPDLSENLPFLPCTFGLIREDTWGCWAHLHKLEQLGWANRRYAVRGVSSYFESRTMSPRRRSPIGPFVVKIIDAKYFRDYNFKANEFKKPERSYEWIEELAKSELQIERDFLMIDWWV